MSVNHKEEPHLVRQLLCYFGQKHASEKMSFSFANPKSHAAEKQGQKHYQYFIPLIQSAHGLIINKLPTQPLSLGGQLVIKKMKKNFK
jgi:hypothetical protein